MSPNNSPIFPFPQPQDEYSDYAFDPQTHECFQKKNREETRKHKSLSRSLDGCRRFKKSGGGRRRWWKSALQFFKWNKRAESGAGADAHKRSITGAPVYYISDTRRKICRPLSVPLAGTMTPARKGEIEIPYVSLRDFSVDQQQRYRMSTPSTMPIYLVT